MRPHGGGAEYTAARAGYRFDVTVGRPLGLGPVVFTIWRTHYANSISLLSRLFIGQSDMGKLGVRKCDPWNRIISHFDPQTEQRMPDHQPGMIICHMGEHHAA